MAAGFARVSWAAIKIWLRERMTFLGCNRNLAVRIALLDCKHYLAAGFAQLFWIATNGWLFALDLWVAGLMWLRSHFMDGVQTMDGFAQFFFWITWFPWLVAVFIWVADG